MGNRGAYLLKDGNSYYFRVKIPKSLKDIFKSGQIKKSLRTDDLQKAERMAKSILDYVKIIFRKVEDGMLTREQGIAFVDEYVAILLEKHEDGFALKGLNGVEWTESHADNIQSQYLWAVAQLETCLRTNDLAPAMQFISWLREEKKYEPENEKEGVILGREFLKGCIQALKICWLRLGGKYDNEYDRRPLTNKNLPPPRISSQTATGNPPVQGSVPQDDSNTLGKRIDEYFKERSTSGRWRISMKNAVQAYLGLLKEHFGTDKNLQDIARPQMIDYRENILKKLPVRRHHDESTKNLPLSELLKRRNVKTISIKTINEYIGNVSSFLAWCYDNNYIAFNVAKGLAIKAKVTEREQKPRYENDEIKRLLGILASFSKKGVMGLKNQDRKWILLLAIYQGMRQNEVCQLKVNDIKIYQGIPCVNITVSDDDEDDECKNVKNINSLRKVPIHPALLKLGFLGFVNARRRSYGANKEGNPQLFQAMTYSKSQGKWTKNIINYFETIKEDIIAGGVVSDRDKKKSFQSIRHSFITEITNNEKIRFAASFLAGHKLKSETDRRYTKTKMDVLLNEISSLNYGCDLFDIFKVPPLDDNQIAEQVQKIPVFED